ncbi:MAG: 50S ribosomal protein L13 [Betaproteobacteria bacterium]|nr:50S ribosomal protein L13 [Betaproteobacteria bacterium]
MKTYTAKAQEVQHDWYVVDAQNKVLGRLASQIALRLRGKHKPEYTPHVDTGDFIVVVNAAGLRVTAKMQAKFPERALEKAVKGMLPKGPLGYAMLKKLKVYPADTHPHTAQQPKALEV